MFKFLKIYYRQYLKLPNGSYNFLSLFSNYFEWRSSLMPGKSTLTDGMPWMTFDAINFLKKNIKKDMRVFEYGSGGSSVFFSTLAKEVVSVEHDKEWFYLVEKNLQDRKIENWKGILCLPESTENQMENYSSNPDAYGTSDRINGKFSFKKYVKTIDQFPDNYFDLIVIDGRSRPSCLKHAVSKIKKNGFILLDNADRLNYSYSIEKYMKNDTVIKLNTFGPTSHNPEFTNTRIWMKI